MILRILSLVLLQILIDWILNCVLDLLYLTLQYLDRVLIYQHILLLRCAIAALWQHLVLLCSSHTCTVLNYDVEKLTQLIYLDIDILHGQFFFRSVALFLLFLFILYNLTWIDLVTVLSSWRFIRGFQLLLCFPLIPNYLRQLTLQILQLLFNNLLCSIDLIIILQDQLTSDLRQLLMHLLHHLYIWLLSIAELVFILHSYVDSIL